MSFFHSTVTIYWATAIVETIYQTVFYALIEIGKKKKKEIEYPIQKSQI